MHVTHSLYIIMCTVKYQAQHVCYFEFLPHSTSKQLRQQQDYRHLISPTVILLKILYLHHCAIFNKKKTKDIN